MKDGGPRSFFVKPRGIPIIGLLTKTSLASEPFDLQFRMTTLWKRGDPHEHGGILKFSLHPPQVSGDSSEVRTVYVPTSVCRIQNLWASK